MEWFLAIACVAACLLTGCVAGSNVGAAIAEERIAAALARQQVAAENAAGLAALRDMEARQEQIRQERLRWIESLGKD